MITFDIEIEINIEWSVTFDQGRGAHGGYFIEADAFPYQVRRWLPWMAAEETEREGWGRLYVLLETMNLSALFLLTNLSIEFNRFERTTP